ncbi:MAG: hypothetical protein WA839_12565, partial [Flavobacteriaceae bacterium]
GRRPTNFVSLGRRPTNAGRSSHLLLAQIGLFIVGLVFGGYGVYKGFHETSSTQLRSSFPPLTFIVSNPLENYVWSCKRSTLRTTLQPSSLSKLVERLEKTKTSSGSENTTAPSALIKLKTENAPNEIYRPGFTFDQSNLFDPASVKVSDDQVSYDQNVKLFYVPVTKNKKEVLNKKEVFIIEIIAKIIVNTSPLDSQSSSQFDEANSPLGSQSSSQSDESNRPLGLQLQSYPSIRRIFDGFDIDISENVGISIEHKYKGFQKDQSIKFTYMLEKYRIIFTLIW